MRYFSAKRYSLRYTLFIRRPVYLKKRPCRKELFCLCCTVLAPVVQMLDSTIHQINHSPVDNYQGNHYCIIYSIEMEIYPLNSIIPAFEVLGPGRRVQPLPPHSKNNWIQLLHKAPNSCSECKLVE